MRSFKWHGIPVNLPSTKSEWLAVWLILGFEVIVIIVVVIALLSN
ncbi:MAG: hypothetical protein ACJ0A9_03185 [Dehalococcoidia bacterium]